MSMRLRGDRLWSHRDHGIEFQYSVLANTVPKLGEKHDLFGCSQERRSRESGVESRESRVESRSTVRHRMTRTHRDVETSIQLEPFRSG